MSDDTWTGVDAYASALFGLVDPSLRSALARSAEGGLPSIQVSECQGQLLYVMARAMGARRVLEIGTLGGFSTIFLARSVGDAGQVVTLELDPMHAEVALANLRGAGVGDRVRILQGDAHVSLQTLIEEGTEPFDLIFLDAEKSGYPAYLTAALELARPGTLIVADNTVRAGAVLDADSTDPNVVGARAYNALVAAHPALSATVLQTVGSKGYDGLTFAVVEER